MCSCVLERARAHSSERCGNSEKASAAVGMLVRLVDIIRVSHRRSPRRLPPRRRSSVAYLRYFARPFAFRHRDRGARGRTSRRATRTTVAVLGGIYVLYSCKPPPGLR